MGLRISPIKILISTIIIIISIVALIFMPEKQTDLNNTSQPTTSMTKTLEPTPTSTPTPVPVNYPASYEMPLRHHTFQTFNNCGPASLSMALSYYDVNISQNVLGNELRPYQNSTGDNDDKSTTLEELAKKAEDLGFVAYHRPNGNEEMIKKFISNDIPIIARTVTAVGEDIGHYRLLRGYTSESFIQDDSLQGKGLQYSVQEFNDLWKIYNYEFLVFVRPEQQDLARRILGENAEFERAWQMARDNAIAELQKNPEDVFARFNLSVAYFNTGDYKKSVEEFETVESQLPFRHLWYQIEPIEAYYKLGQYDRVFEITDEILNNHNRAFSEVYIIRGDIYKNQGNLEMAKEEYQKAVFYNNQLEEAQSALRSI